MTKRGRVSLYVLEGAWDKPHEAPQVLPYFEAYANTFRAIDFNHRTFRCIEDVEYYVSRLPKGKRAFLYFACHGEVGSLIPSDAKNKIPSAKINNALSRAKENAIGFVHFGCCSYVRAEPNARRATLSAIQSASGAAWVSGYTTDVDWLPSTLLDLALINDIYVPWAREPTQKAKHEKRINVFSKSYAELCKALGLSALNNVSGNEKLFPSKVSSPQ